MITCSKCERMKAEKLKKDCLYTSEQNAMFMRGHRVKQSYFFGHVSNTEDEIKDYATIDGGHLIMPLIVHFRKYSNSSIECTVDNAADTDMYQRLTLESDDDVRHACTEEQIKVCSLDLQGLEMKGDFLRFYNYIRTSCIAFSD